MEKRKQLNILQVKDRNHEDDKRFRDIDYRLPKPPFLGIINGSVRTGKSTLLMNLLYNDSFFKDVFDQVVFISPTCLNDNTLTHLRDVDDVVKICDKLHDIDLILKSLVEIQKKTINGKNNHMLVVLDDMLGYIKPRSYLAFLCTRYRHFKISLIISSQSFRSIPNVVRTNASFYIIFSTTNNKELEKLNEEFNGLFPNFKQLLKQATEQPYHLLFLDLKKVRAFMNFDKLLYEKIPELLKHITESDKALKSS